MHNPANQSKHTIISILNSFFMTYLLLVFPPPHACPFAFYYLFFYTQRALQILIAICFQI